MSLKLAPSKALTSHSLSATELSDKDRGEEPVDVMPYMEWIARVDSAKQDIEILGKQLN